MATDVAAIHQKVGRAMDHVGFLRELATRKGEPVRAVDAEKLREIADYLDELLMEKYGPRI